MSKEIKIAGSISFGGKRLNVYGDLDAPLFKAKVRIAAVHASKVMFSFGKPKKTMNNWIKSGVPRNTQT